MTSAITHIAAVVAGLAIIASPLMIARSGLLRSPVAAVGEAGSVIPVPDLSGRFETWAAYFEFESGTEQTMQG